MMAGADPAMPADTPLLAVLAGFEANGFVEQFIVLDEGSIRCQGGDHRFSADDAIVDGERRLEGVSDPADMMIVVGLTCSVYRRKGTLVVHYGPAASAAEADALVALSTAAGRSTT